MTDAGTRDIDELAAAVDGPLAEETRPPLSLGGKVHDLLHRQSLFGPLAVLGVSLLVFALLGDGKFFKTSTFSLIIQQTAVVATLAIGQSLVVLTAGIDLSNGSVMVLSSIVMAKLSADQGVPGLIALLAGLAVGLLCGLVNGALVTRLKLPPFIVTLGTLYVFFTLNLWYSDSATIRGEDMSWLLLWTGRTFSVLNTKFTYGSILMLAMFVVFAWVLHNTAWGRHVYAAGDDPEAARLAGIRTSRLLLSVYVVAGLTYAMGAWVLIGRIASASPQAGQLDNLNTITAVAIGGISLFGGRGNLLGTLLGALIVGVFRTGLFLAGVDDIWQNFAVGILIIAAVAVDQRIRSVRA